MKSKIMKGLIVLANLLVIGTLSFGGYLYAQARVSASNSYKPTDANKKRATPELNNSKPLSILLLGTDTGELNRDLDDARTDSMMVLTINPEKKTTTIVSIPRDTMTKIVGYEDKGYQKINAAYSFGGTKASIETVQKLLNIPIDHYALVNMGGMENLIDTIGGVSVTSPLDFSYSQDTAHAYGPNLYRFHKDSNLWEHSNDNGQTWSPSESKMTGDAALAFSRMRYDDPQGDYGRQLRQRLILDALIKETTHPQNLLNSKFTNLLSNSIQTSLSFDDLTNLAKNYLVCRDNIVNDHLQGTSEQVNGVWYEKVSDDEIQRVHNLIDESLGLPSDNQSATDSNTDSERTGND